MNRRNSQKLTNSPGRQESAFDQLVHIRRASILHSSCFGLHCRELLQSLTASVRVADPSVGRPSLPDAR